MKAFLILLMFFISPCISAAPIWTSVIRLLANPIQFDGQAIIVSGYVCQSQTKKLGLFLSKADCDDANYGNAVELELPASLSRSKYKKPKICTVEGIFSDRTKFVFTDEVFLTGVIKVTTMTTR